MTSTTPNINPIEDIEVMAVSKFGNLATGKL
jgi:hypothetical protein